MFYILRVLFSLVLVVLTLSASPAQKIYTSTDRWGNMTSDCVAIIENNKIFRGSGAFLHPRRLYVHPGKQPGFSI
ncbi:MAG: hypothetical protein HC880_21260 [Bacteroidia bacterium]|nr:hypothetical protein [Bacteroidia bacterium]